MAQWHSWTCCKQSKGWRGFAPFNPSTFRNIALLTHFLRQRFFKILLKSSDIIFTKPIQFSKNLVVSQTFSISSLKFLLKLASHYEKLQNVSQVFHSRWETLDSWFFSMGSCRTSDLFPTCQWTIAELCGHKFAILSVDSCGTKLTWFRTFCPASTPATCLWTIAEVVYRHKFGDCS